MKSINDNWFNADKTVTTPHMSICRSALSVDTLQFLFDTEMEAENHDCHASPEDGCDCGGRE